MRFRVLDSFRGIAALMLAVYHLHIAGSITSMDLVRNAYLLVDFFFVLSGFVICYSYQKKLNDMDDLKTFMIKRFSRLWPLHVFMTVMFIPFALANLMLNIDLGERFSLSSFISNVFLIQALSFNNDTTWNIPAWSISVEFFTYLVFGLFCVLLARLGQLTVIRCLVIASVSALILYNYSTMGDGHHLAIFRCIYSFFLGVIAFRVYKQLPVKGWMETLVVSALILALSATQIQNDSVGAYLMPILFFIVIVVFAREQGAISGFLLHPWFEKLGLLSFSVYLTHAWFISSLKALATLMDRWLGIQIMATVDGARVLDFGAGYFNDLMYIPYFALVLMASAWTHKYIEMPWQKKINNASLPLKPALPKRSRKHLDSPIS